MPQTRQTGPRIRRFAVPRSVTLVALWAVFAVASVSVGFAAASMVSDPFTDVDTSSEAVRLRRPGRRHVHRAAAARASPTGTRQPVARADAEQDPDRWLDSGQHDATAPARRSPSSAASPPGAATSRPPAADGLVSVGAAPALYWQVDSRTPPGVRTGGSASSPRRTRTASASRSPRPVPAASPPSALTTRTARRRRGRRRWWRRRRWRRSQRQWRRRLGRVGRLVRPGKR